MKKIKHCLNNSKNKAIALMTSLFVSTLSYADLPTVQQASRSSGTGIMATIRDHGYDAAILVGLLVSTVAFIVVAMVLIGGFKEVSQGKKTWGDFGMFGAVGFALLVLVIWLLSESAKIL